MATPEYEINLKDEYGNRWTCFHFYLTRATGSSELLPSLFFQHPLTFPFWSSAQEPLDQIEPNLDVTLLGWSSFKSVFTDLALHQRWLPWLLIGWKIWNLWRASSIEPLDFMKVNLVHWFKYFLGNSLSKFCLLTLLIIHDHHDWLCNFFFSLILSFWHPILLKLWFWVIWLLSFQSYAP
jgi:hypothetical protein